VAVRSRIVVGAAVLRGGRCRSQVGSLRCPVGACFACRGSGAHSWPAASSWSSALGSAQPSSNYAFKRTAGRLHRVSCCSVGPRPLNASLGVGEPGSLSVGSRGSVAARFSMLPELAHRRRVHHQFSHFAFGARLLSVNVTSFGAQAGSAQGSGRRAEDAPAPSCHQGSVRLATFAASIQSPLRGHTGMLEGSGTHRHPTMRSSGPRGQATVFPDMLSARGRLTRR
jgi:hypothetical protein